MIDPQRRAEIMERVDCIDSMLKKYEPADIDVMATMLLEASNALRELLAEPTILDPVNYPYDHGREGDPVLHAHRRATDKTFPSLSTEGVDQTLQGDTAHHAVRHSRNLGGTGVGSCSLPSVGSERAGEIPPAEPYPPGGYGTTAKPAREG